MASWQPLRAQEEINMGSTLLSKQTLPLVVQPGVLISPLLSEVGSMNGSCMHDPTIKIKANTNPDNDKGLVENNSDFIWFLFN
jgi:hypothetical protein